MTLSTDIIDRLSRSLKPFWHYTQHDVIGDAMAEITKLRAERDAAARDMRERHCAEARAVLDEIAKSFEDSVHAVWDAGEVATHIRGYPLIATDGGTGK